MFIYEVTLVVDDSIRKEFTHWLEPHMAEVVSVGGFTEAQWYVDEAASEGDPGRWHWVVQYHCEHRDSLDGYLKDHAPRLRADGVQRFGEKMKASRRILRRLHGVKIDSF